MNRLNQAKVVCLDVLRWSSMFHSVAFMHLADAFDLKLVAKLAFDRQVSH